MPRLADLDVELIRAESDKYAVPLMLLHGAWTGPWIWRAAAGDLGHRGWNCWAVAWRGAGGTWPEARARLQRAAGELGHPVVIGHDVGGLLAMALRDVSAAVAIAPIEAGPRAGPHPLARSLRARVARWRGVPFKPGDAPARGTLGLSAADLVAEAPTWCGPESTLSAVADGVPRLLVAGDHDPCLGSGAARALAAEVGAEFAEVAGAGHDLPYGPHGQRVVAEVHRWLVRRLGGDLLLLRGDEDLVDD